MVGKRLLLLLGVCALTAAAAWADDVGYVDCREHPDQTQVFAKARQTHEVVASVPCGERFTILLYGFIFSRIQTKDGQVGYVFSNVVSVDRSGASVQRTAPAPVPAVAPGPATPAVSAAQVPPGALAQLPSASAQPSTMPAPVTKIPEASAGVARDNPKAFSQPQKTSTQPTPESVTKIAETPAPEPAAKAAEISVTVTQPVAIDPPQHEVTPPQATSTPAPASIAPETSAAPPAPNPTAPVQTAPAEPAPASKAPETPEAVAQPNPPATPEAEPAPAQPAAPAIRAADARESWEKPNRGTRRAPAIELFGGYAFARFDSGAGTTTNLNGALGSFGWNVNPWLQVVADTSYNTVTVSGTKNVLYGNHWGPRIFRRGRAKWATTPFVEALFGGSRADTTVSGAAGYKTSQNSFSFKVGGGLDIKPSRYLEIRLIDFDYYRTSFGVNLHQNNYWASTGIVLRLFGGGAE